MKAIVSRFAKDTSGATAIEYGLIAGLVSIVIITALTLLGPQLTSVFEAITDALSNVATVETPA
jgi:pilus assembly protein Flp/PilA